MLNNASDKSASIPPVLPSAAAPATPPVKRGARADRMALFVIYAYLVSVAVRHLLGANLPDFSEIAYGDYVAVKGFVAGFWAWFEPRWQTIIGALAAFALAMLVRWRARQMSLHDPRYQGQWPGWIIFKLIMSTILLAIMALFVYTWATM